MRETKSNAPIKEGGRHGRDQFKQGPQALDVVTLGERVYSASLIPPRRFMPMATR
ncbi:hypothetical protein AMYX_22700 [Anaeromyxobacter diazotrophicus]|uniref:Uncharacterized protein n=1 Tax=Anaeromyxobacter diazotrophicus TaxID=2590199 RepID=A0A7I9VN15_9BACT|nr:hypothetical protein AMYX_22700 [Anaeromyxobacter diazotrophicus]